jgi:hypothetical protein
VSFKAFVISLSIAILAALPWRAAAVQSVALEWTPSSSPDVAGYIVRYGLASGNYTEQVKAGNSTTAQITDLVEGQTYYFTVTDYDAAGVESAPSNEAAYAVPSFAPPGNPSLHLDPATGQTVLTWSPSPATGSSLAGYNVYCKTIWGDYVVFMASTDTPQFVLPDWTLEAPFYVVVTDYYSDNGESAASTEVSLLNPVMGDPLDDELAVTSGVTVVPAPVLALQPQSAGGLTGVFSITASGAVPASWALEGSSDLQTWGTLTTGSDPAVNVTVVVSPKPKLFFRLASSLPDVSLQTQTPADALPHSFCINTADTEPSEWSIEASEDLQTWNPLTTGSGTAVNLAVVTAAAPSLFFRLKSL